MIDPDLLTASNVLAVAMLVLRRTRPDGRRYRARLLAHDLAMLRPVRESHLVDIRV